MERFVRRENIKRFRRLLGEAKDHAERQRILKLLLEEEQKEQAAKSGSAPFERVDPQKFRADCWLVGPNGQAPPEFIRSSEPRSGD